MEENKKLNEFLEKNKKSHFLQSPEWAKLKSEWEHEMIVVEKNDEIKPDKENVGDDVKTEDGKAVADVVSIAEGEVVGAVTAEVTADGNVGKAVEAVGRQPEAVGAIRSTMIMGQAVAETTVLPSTSSSSIFMMNLPPGAAQRSIKLIFPGRSSA